MPQPESKQGFPWAAPTALPVFYRTYSRRGQVVPGQRETWDQVCDRTLEGLKDLGNLTDDEVALLSRMQRQVKALPSGRWLWVGGTDWSKKPENFPGAFNCTGTNVVDWRAFGLMMDLAMQGCGTGAVLEDKYISQIPAIRNHLNVTISGDIGTAPPEERQDDTEVIIAGNQVRIRVGDSRQGWTDSYEALLELSTDPIFTDTVHVSVDLSHVRAAGERLRGFGGMANPVKLPELYGRCATILNKVVGRQLNAVECCLLIDEAAGCVVAGNIRRCLPEDALVHTDHGLVSIKDVQVGDLVQTPLGFRRVVNKFDQGIQDVYEVEANGPTPRATLNHRMAVLTSATGEYEWKNVEALAEGDRLLHNTQILPGGVTSLPSDFTSERPQQSRTAKEMVVPALTPDVAWMIGYTHGNGYVSLGRNKHNKPFGLVSWSMNALSDITPKIQSRLEKVVSAFGLTVSHTSVKGENTAVTRCQSIRMAEYFHRYIKQPNTPLNVPTFILQGSIDVRSAYLAGLMDSDGAINNRPPHLVTTVYQDFARQVAVVLSSLGIAGRPRMTAPQKESWRVRHHVTIPALKEDYNNLIAPHSIKGRLHQGLKMYGFTLPGVMMRETYTYSGMQAMGFQGARGVDSNYERYRAESDVQIDIPVTVKGIGSYTSVQTYDIEVEEAHCFYCDGYLTHNSAGIRQFDSFDNQAATAKDNLWQQGTDGEWRIDPERDALRMANHTRVFHKKPSLDECIAAVTKQFWSGEGAIQWAGEAIARSSADLLNTHEKKKEFLERYCNSKGDEYLGGLMDNSPMFSDELEHRLQRYSLNPCGEIVSSNFFCNLAEVHLNLIDPDDYEEQNQAFSAAGLAVAVLLNRQFVEPRYRQAREFDPIVGVSFTGLFDFFVQAFGVDWLRWWEAGRPATGPGLEFKRKEQEYLTRWKEIAHQVVWDYCDRHGLKRPNRCTTVQPAGTKSLLTGASPGWHPPKAQRYIRRITFGKNDPVAMACIDYGYSVVPSQSDKDENGNLLNDPFDPRCTEWLVEIPVEVSWANLPGADEIAIEKFSAKAQFDFYMQVQKHYTTHNASATLEIRRDEIEEMGTLIYNAIQNDDGYISATILARFDDLQTFPRLPFEPIDQETFEHLSEAVLERRKTGDFHAALAQYDAGPVPEAGPAGCDSDKCMMPEKKPT